MKSKHSSARQATMLRGVLTGTGITVLIALLISLVIAAMLNSETVGEGSIGLFNCLSTVIALFLGILFARKVYPGKAAIVSLAVGGIYFLILLCTNLLFFGGDLRGVLAQIISILVGTLMGVLPSFWKQKSFKRKRISASR